MNQPRRSLEVQTIDNVAIATIALGHILDDQIVAQFGTDLLNLYKLSGYQRIVVNCGKLEYLSALAIGKFILLRKEIEGCKGKLALCCIDCTILEAFKITGFDRILKIYPSEQEALQYVAA